MVQVPELLTPSSNLILSGSNHDHINSNTPYDSVRGFGANKELGQENYQKETPAIPTQNNGYVSGVTSLDLP